MDKITILDHQFELHIAESEILAATARVADRINADYGAGEPPIMLVTLSGALLFAAELFKHLAFDSRWAFVKCASYGASLSSSGEVRMTLAPTVDVAGRDVIVVEDVVDTGSTWIFLHKYLLEQGARSVKLVTMTLKTEIYDKSLPVDYVALEIEDKFVVGYGLDYNQSGRNLRGIYKLSD